MDVVVQNTIEMPHKSLFSVLTNLDVEFTGRCKATTRGVSHFLKEDSLLFVPVQSSTGDPLMPTTPARARRLMRNGRAYSFWLKGVFCIRLKSRTEGTVQEVAVGIDPGSKREAFTVKSGHHTYLNILSDAVTWVKDSVERRHKARRNRRKNKTPYRMKRRNRKQGRCLPPSTKARWQIKLNICKWLVRLFPIKTFAVENVKFQSKKGKGNRWDKHFSPLGAGKNWFYGELKQLGEVELLQGYETFELRNQHSLTKSKDKMKESFDAHCVDSWVLANSKVWGHSKPDNEDIFRIIPLMYRRRQLHKFQPAKGGIRLREGSTRSLGFKRGSLVFYPKLGLVYVGGYSQRGITLHSLRTSERLTQRAKANDMKFLCYSSYRFYDIKGNR